MKKVLAVALIGFVAISCSKGETSDPQNPVSEEDRILFAAEAPSTRSYFPGTSGLMYWSAFDNLAVYAFKGEDTSSAIVSDLCRIKSESVGTNEGKFTPKNFLCVSHWFKNNASADDTYSFYAYYPESNAPATYRSGTVLLSVPSAQTGEFGRHQICSSALVSMKHADVKKERYVRFAFSPVTSLIRVRLVLSSDSDVEEAVIKQLTLTARESNICGNCTLTFPNTLAAAAASEGSTHTVSVSLSTPVTITKKAEDNPYIDFVILPTAETTGQIDFSAYMADGTKLTLLSKGVPTTGFEAGKRYFLDREIKVKIDVDTTPDASYIDGGFAWDGEGDHDGAYTDGGTAWEFIINWHGSQGGEGRRLH